MFSNSRLEDRFNSLFEDIDQDEFLDRWVSLICDHFPQMQKDQFYNAYQLLNNQLNNSERLNGFLTLFHVKMITSIISILEDKEHILGPIKGTAIAAYALEFTCGIALETTNEIEPENIFDRLSEEYAKQLFTYMCLIESDFLGPYINWLDTNAVIDFKNWNPTQKWIDEPPRNMSTATSSSANVPEISSGHPQIHPEMAKKYPRLQKLLNTVYKRRAFSTAEPIIDQLVSQVEDDKGLKQHIALLGPPGVGKTESVEILRFVLAGLGVAGDKFFRYTPAKNAEEHVGHPEREMGRILEMLKEEGGVLLVDEAATLFESKTDPNRTQNFRQRAMQPILSEFEHLLDHQVVVIFAGYREGFEKFLTTDPGWSRRVQLFDIEPPTVQKLAEHVVSSLKDSDFRFPEKLHQNVLWLFQDLVANNSMEFGYWGTADVFINALKSSRHKNILLSGPNQSKDIDAASFTKAARSLGYRRDVEKSWVGPTIPEVAFEIPDTPEAIKWDLDK